MFVKEARTLVTHATSAAKPSTCAFSASSAFRDTNSGKYEFCRNETKPNETKRNKRRRKTSANTRHESTITASQPRTADSENKIERSGLEGLLGRVGGKSTLYFIRTGGVQLHTPRYYHARLSTTPPVTWTSSSLISLSIHCWIASHIWYAQGRRM